MFIWLLIILLVLIVFLVWSYNTLISKYYQVKEAKSQILVQIKRKLNLIPNLVEAVKSYKEFEKDLLEKVTQMRSRLNYVEDIDEIRKINEETTKIITRLLAVFENYPNLKASELYKKLMDELKDTEDRIAYARQFYNQAVMEYNSYIRSFPGFILAKLLGYKEEKFFEENLSEEIKINL